MLSIEASQDQLMSICFTVSPTMLNKARVLLPVPIPKRPPMGGLSKTLSRNRDSQTNAHKSTGVSECPNKMEKMLLVGLMALLVMGAQALDYQEIRRLAIAHNITSILVFGDSSVDPGNNNRLSTTFKGNFPPYGKDFYNGSSTGRFTNGRLPTDFIAEDLGFERIVPGFLDKRGLNKEELLHGVSFASAATGYDDLTANFTNVLSISKQIVYLMHYKIQLRELVGPKREEEIVRNAIFIMSAGTNDFIQNYYLYQTRSKQFTIDKYVDYLITCLAADIKKMHRLGGSRFAVVGMPPIGCMPLVKNLKGVTACVDSLNQVAATFNSKLQAQLSALKTTLDIKVAYGDIYNALISAIKTPTKYGFRVSSKGCVGTGQFEFGDSCKGQSVCADPNQYVFWDAVHPTQKMYRLIADEVLTSVANEIF
ncbi:GDSL esterase/lipase [Cinnamomum micranthum f. kanehirae]|uniref:GDSL esterase/lipase n=1 Tax=Cinnamomum micranthum f. kanehirae TaxID=337451 RepID=A0A3S3N032_9MAGN|nr:GDSL esterase/lipase [Cinnamomum micranthum f. kanehirae]